MDCLFCKIGQMVAVAIGINEYDPTDISILAQCDNCEATMLDEAGQPPVWTPADIAGAYAV